MRPHIVLLRRQRTQSLATKLIASLQSQAVPTNYDEVEMLEHQCLAAFTGGYAEPDHWDQLAECRNVLMFGAGHCREDAKAKGQDWSEYQQIVDLCYQVKDAMLAIREREQKTGRMGVNGDQLELLSACIATSADFWSQQPGWLFRKCVEAVRAMNPMAPKANRRRK